METVAATGTVYLRPPRGQSAYLMCSARRAPVEQRFLAERFRLRGKTAPSAAQRRYKMGQWLLKLHKTLHSASVPFVCEWFVVICLKTFSGEP